ncbi:MAG: FKBP-type peptidyl-prolyl cis-trans isomerase [Gammaproteobacteria bacterium]|nr:FKBP-type peptidyl-prolyl cis-trans isomerase [Gammaproteobacteria bacterium]MBU1444169.1 FKBP-type peptidyl-prolyl cis-trans isomerase [Gammaproteobacteria bacterium]MBU2287337.1 FKBP-type peptidyl-prolyl cis-trans isomerase [Gammaproteobacteria bacterium]
MRRDILERHWYDGLGPHSLKYPVSLKRIPSPLTSHLATVAPGSFLTLHYRLAGPAGDVINTFPGKPATLSLGTGELTPALEQRLQGMTEGAHATFELAPGEAFGDRNADMQQWVARELLSRAGDPGEHYAVGDVVQFPAPEGGGNYAGVVIELSDTAVRFDFNHPLAGQPVTFEVRLIGVL